MRFLLYIAQNYSYSMVRPLQAEILARGHTVAWFLEGNEVSPQYLRSDERQLHTIDEVQEYHPDVVLVPGNMVPDFIPGLKVAVFHGFNTGKRSDNEGHFRIRGCFDLYCTQGPNTTQKFKQLAQQHGYFNVIETGWPALDPLYQHAEPDTQARDERPTVLMCSTFTERLSCALPLYDVVRSLSQSNKWCWLIQFHPKMHADTVQKYKALENDNLQFVETDNVVPLLHSADLMVCDTSSILFMFLLLQKPVVTFNNNAPGPYLYNIHEPQQLEQAIEATLKRPAQLMNQIAEFTQQLHPYHDGRSAGRVLDAIDEVLSGQHPLRRKRPKQRFRNLRVRRKLNYWKSLI